MGDTTTSANTAAHIGNNYFYSMFSSGWAWAVMSKTGKGTLHKYVVAYGGGEGVFLAASYFYNGYNNASDDALAAARSGTKFTYYESRNTIAVGLYKEFTAPTNWKSRIKYYRLAKTIWR